MPPQEVIMLKIYNTKTRKKEVFTPIHEGRVGMYVCGPTVYGPPHLGHAKSYVNFDLVHRYFRALGYKVKYVQNITDVGHLVGDGDDGEDKIGRQAKLEQLDPYEIAYKYECEYFAAMDALNILRPSVSPRASGFIPDIIDAVQEIVDKGYGYVTKEGNVYFDVYKYSGYGSLSNRTLDQTLSGERIAIAGDKKHNEDFALWKAVSPNTLMKWRSPWGWGCPGWHIECSVLSRKFLGDRFDIHGGGIDNLFPHHECECAQGGVLGVDMNFFMHNNLVTINGQKMGKSLGNFTTLASLFQKFEPRVVRFFILQFHYRSAIDFSDEAIMQAQKILSKIDAFVQEVRALTDKTQKPTGDVKALYDDCLAALDDDFNTPVLLANVLKLVKMPLKAPEQLNFVIQKVLVDIMGLTFAQKVQTKDNIPQNVQDLAQKRWQAKQSRDFATADSLRNQLLSLGYEVKDGKDGFILSKCE